MMGKKLVLHVADPRLISGTIHGALSHNQEGSLSMEPEDLTI